MKYQIRALILSTVIFMSTTFDDRADDPISYLPANVTSVSYVKLGFPVAMGRRPVEAEAKFGKVTSTLPDGRPYKLFSKLQVENLIASETFVLEDVESDENKDTTNVAEDKSRGIAGYTKRVSLSYVNSQGQNKTIFGTAKLVLCMIYRAKNVDLTIDEALKDNTLHEGQEYRGYPISVFSITDAEPYYYSRISDKILLESTSLRAMKAMIDTGMGDRGAFIDTSEYEDLEEILEDINANKMKMGGSWKYRNPNHMMRTRKALVREMKAPLEAMMAAEKSDTPDEPATITVESTIVLGNTPRTRQVHFIFNSEDKAKEYYEKEKLIIDQENKTGDRLIPVQGSEPIKSASVKVVSASIKCSGRIVSIERVTKADKLP